MFDCHVHSNFSTDSNVSGELYCQEAIKKGLSGIALTDHLDYDFPGFEDQYQFDQDACSDFMDDLKKKYKDDLKVLKGIEVGIQPHVISITNEVLDKYYFDYILCSVHIIGGVDPYKGEYYSGISKYQAYNRYLEEILFAITHFDNFDMLGHIEYITRYSHYEDKTLRYHYHSDIIDEILKTLIASGKGFEINSGTYKAPLSSNDLIFTLEYDADLLKRYKELGGELLCLGSDSHSLESLGFNFSYFTELAKACGFNYFVHFENRKPVFSRI